MTSGTVDAPAAGVALIAVQVEAVRALRDSRALIAAEHAESIRQFEEAHAEQIARLKQFTVEVASAEAMLKALVVEHFKRTREKKPTNGVEVKLRTVLDYTEADAMAWAKQTGLCLLPESLDAKGFAKIASVQSLPFVTRREEPQAQIASDLGKALSNG